MKEGGIHKVYHYLETRFSRFRKLFLPRYSEAQFLEVLEKVLPKTSQSLARFIGASVSRKNYVKDGSANLIIPDNCTIVHPLKILALV